MRAAIYWILGCIIAAAVIYHDRAIKHQAFEKFVDLLCTDDLRVRFDRLNEARAKKNASEVQIQITLFGRVIEGNYQGDRTSKQILNDIAIGSEQRRQEWIAEAIHEASIVCSVKISEDSSSSAMAFGSLDYFGHILF